VLYMKTNVHFLSYLPQFSLEWEMFQTTIVEKIKTHFVLGIFFFKSCRLWENVEKYCRAGHATDDNTAHAHCMLDTQGYKYIHSLCSTLIAFPQQQWLHEHVSIRTLLFLFCINCRWWEVTNSCTHYCIIYVLI